MQAKETVKKLTDKLQSSDLETRPGRTMLETFEDEVNQALNKARDDSGKEAQRSLDSTNNVVRMVSAGSKGSFINISQVQAHYDKSQTPICSSESEIPTDLVCACLTHPFRLLH